jgi:glutaredoxin
MGNFFGASVDRSLKKIILYTAPSWCPACQQFEKQWNLLTPYLRRYNVEYSRHTHAENKLAFEKKGIKQYPTIVFRFRDGREKRYKGKLTARDVAHVVKKIRLHKMSN